MIMHNYMLSDEKCFPNFSSYRNGNSFKSIWLTYVSCYSYDKCLVDDCNSCPSSAVTSCSHSEDVTLDCGK